jgi:hypothetical protein
VLAAVSALPERQREAIVLRELEGRSYADIGRRLGASGGAVRQLIVRARQTVRAAAAAFTPAGLVARVPWLGNSMAGHSAEISAGAGVSAASVQVWVAALVTCTMGGSVVMLSKQDEPSASAAAVDAPTAALAAERKISTPLVGEAKELRRAALQRAAAATPVANREASQNGVGAEAPAEAPTEVSPPASDCGAPPAGTANRRRARRSCSDPTGPPAFGNVGPNDPPIGGPTVPTRETDRPTVTVPILPEPEEDPRSSTEPPPPEPPPPGTGQDPRDDNPPAPPDSTP